MVTRIGLGSSFGVGSHPIEAAYHEYGVNYLYWGTIPRPGFGKAIRNLARAHREDLVVVLQSYQRSAALIRASLALNLKRLRLDYADVLLLGLYNRRPANRLLDAAKKLQEQGRIRYIAISAHRRPTFQQYIDEGFFDILHVRYNAAHGGAEEEVFPFLPKEGRQGVVAFTATRWGSLIGQSETGGPREQTSATDCYRFALTHPDVDLVLCGPKDGEQLAVALSALDLGPLDEGELDWMRRIGDRVHG